jgi:hypothetical protein
MDGIVVKQVIKLPDKHIDDRLTGQGTIFDEHRL